MARFAVVPTLCCDFCDCCDCCDGCRSASFGLGRLRDIPTDPGGLQTLFGFCWFAGFEKEGRAARSSGLLSFAGRRSSAGLTTCLGWEFPTGFLLSPCFTGQLLFCSAAEFGYFVECAVTGCLRIVLLVQVSGAECPEFARRLIFTVASLGKTWYIFCVSEQATHVYVEVAVNMI